VVAVKMFEALRLDQADDKVLNELRMEAQMMERLSNHPNIVKFVGAITRGKCPSDSDLAHIPVSGVEADITTNHCARSCQETREPTSRW
jgi:hypothetical protein